jgi:hypothetical protein
MLNLGVEGRNGDNISANRYQVAQVKVTLNYRYTIA